MAGTAEIAIGRSSVDDAPHLARAVMSVDTRGEGFCDITREIAGWLGGIGAGEGMVHAFCRHTSASLTIQENADPDVIHDLVAALHRLAPQGVPYRHAIEGPDDMPAHIRTMLTVSGLSIPVAEGRMLLGTWQGVYLIEHRSRPHHREIVLSFVGQLARG